MTEIPKIVHQIWLGSRPPPLALMRTWDRMADWEHRVWRDADIEALDLENRRYYEGNDSPHTRSDIARWEILWRFGGFYADCDFTWEGHQFEQHLPMGSEFMATTEHDYPDPKHWYRLWQPHWPGKSAIFLANGFMAAKPRNKSLRRIIDAIPDSIRLNPTKSGCHTVGCFLLTHMLREPITYIPNDWIFPSTEPEHAFHLTKYHADYLPYCV